jgi:hypothetical protein
VPPGTGAGPGLRRTPAEFGMPGIASNSPPSPTGGAATNQPIFRCRLLSVGVAEYRIMLVLINAAAKCQSQNNTQDDEQGPASRQANNDTEPQAQRQNIKHRSKRHETKHPKQERQQQKDETATTTEQTVKEISRHVHCGNAPGCGNVTHTGETICRG